MSDYPVKVNENATNNTDNDSSDLSTVVGNQVFSIAPGESTLFISCRIKTVKNLLSLFVSKRKIWFSG